MLKWWPFSGQWNQLWVVKVSTHQKRQDNFTWQWWAAMLLWVKLAGEYLNLKSQPLLSQKLNMFLGQIWPVLDNMVVNHILSFHHQNYHKFERQRWHHAIYSFFISNCPKFAVDLFSKIISSLGHWCRPGDQQKIWGSRIHRKRCRSKIS